jgi:hypothetical protein
MLDYFVPKGKRVWSSTPIAESYCNTEVMIGYQSAEGELIQDILTTAVVDNQASVEIHRFTFPRRLMEHLRLAQTASAGDIWSIGELQVFDGDREIPRAPAWRISAAPFPWDAGLVFDRNPVTRWKAWEPAHPGMHVDIDFGALTEIDRIELHSSRDQANVQIQTQACGAAGCGAFPAKAESIEAQPLGDLRRLAAGTVKGRGIDYLLIDDPYRIAADVRSDPARWGMELVVARGPYRVYRIQ